MTPRRTGREQGQAGPTLLAVVSLLGIALLSWPIIQIPGAHGTLVWFVYLFAVWIGLVTLLRVVGNRIRRSERAAPESVERDGAEGRR